jgi:hypothetical protein
MTDDSSASRQPAPPRQPPPDPDEYDTERNAAARRRGLAAPYIPGGRDPEPEDGLREERYYLRILLIMVAVIVAAGFVLGILANLFSLVSGG